MAGPIYNPPIPFLGPIPGGFMPGRMLRIQGSVPYGAQRFAINLQCGPNTDPRDDIALHINFRFPEQCVVRNHLQSMSWGPEETAGGIPLQPGGGFEILVLCDNNALKVALNGMHFCEFIHRLPYQRISYVTVDGEVQIHTISFEGQSAQQQQGGYMQPGGYSQQGYGGAPPPYSQQPDMMPQQAPMMMAGQPVQQQRSGMGTGAAVGLGVGALAAGGLAGYALGGGFGSDSPPHASSIPYVGLIPGGFMPGSMVRFRGSVPYESERFAINLQCGPTINEDDIAFHINFRFLEECVVRNDLQAYSWGTEERAGGIPLQPGANFDILVLCENSALIVEVNGVHFCQFNHRMPYQRISHVAVYEDVLIQTINFEAHAVQPSAEYALMNPTTYNPTYNNYGGGGAGPL